MEGTQQAKEKDLILGVTNTGQLAYLHVLRVEQDCIIGWPVNLPKHKEVSIPHGAYKVLVTPPPHVGDPMLFYVSSAEGESATKGDEIEKQGQQESGRLVERMKCALTASADKEPTMNRTVLQGSFDTGTIQELETMGRTLTDEDVQRIAKAVWDAGGQSPVQTLDAASTADLVRVLSEREGVGRYAMPLPSGMSIEVEGPATILIIPHVAGGATE